MKFYLIFLLVAAVLGIKFYAYPAYKLDEAEKNIRKSIQNIPDNARAHALNRIEGYPAKAEVLNRYPKILVYIMLSDYKEKSIPPTAEVFLKKFSCSSLDGMKNHSDLYRQANLNLMQKDNHQIEFIVRNMYGEVLLKFQQTLTACPRYQEMKDYIAPKEQQNTGFTSNNQYVSPETAARARQAENGY